MSQRPAFEARAYFTILPPLAGGSGTAPGVIAIAATSSAALLDLTTMPGARVNAGLTAGNDSYNPNPTGHFLFMEADGTDVYIVFGPSKASVSAGNAPLSSAVSTVDANGVLTQVAQGCLKLVNGTFYRFLLPANTGTRDDSDVGTLSPARWLGFVTASGTTGTLRIYQGSP